MTPNAANRVALALVAGILLAAALQFARAVAAPVAMSLFVIAVVWPLQRALETRLPRLLAMLVSVGVTFGAIGAVGWLITWEFGAVGRWLVANVGRFQSFYLQTTAWLEGHGVLLVGGLADQLNVVSLLRMFQDIAARINALVGFAVLLLIFTILGLLEVGDFKRKIQALGNGQAGTRFLRASESIAGKFRRYLVVRTIASIATGLAVWAFAAANGLDLAIAWGVLAFALNYIPVIGPLVATVAPTLFAGAQFESWQIALRVFIGLNVIQFVIGSYLEPRFSGASLAISPFVIVLSVFFWTFLWGIPGAFIGVPVTIAIVTLFESGPATRWVAALLSQHRHDGL